MNLPSRLPKRLYPFFWDIDAKNFSPAKKPYFAIQRLLDRGDTEAVRWVRRNFPESLIKETFEVIRDFNASTGNFWANFLKIPKDKVLCLQEPYLSMRRSHWPY
ncbi:hypothetical protein HY440_03770 [Candidatus Microgenomates bacterium]|nr:hypothetical protein [Candidatus Microgenomates bacterium]